MPVNGEDQAEGAGGPSLREEQDVEKIREEVLAKLEKPLEKMKVKELKQLLTERGVTCTACSEKDQLVKTVHDSLHLPVKKENLQKVKMPSQTVEDDEMQHILAELKKKQEKENELKEMLRKQGMNVDGMNFGGGMDPAMLEKILKNPPGGKKQDL
eukprot:CAMPEP_0196724884 /NCGR_PEP_ID=MMETSP1091-20130531/6601_1 /TAXON_ID=302021 /ORGANISM="Rhodomonas sp., Strain CCMP768" /LENGTH=155 /DNA_ID=CAMNT_0042067079 /DNA_START=77 /DNA_END=544 /DNA_ORIENTATION=+